MKINKAFFVSILMISGVSCGPTTETIEAPFELTSDFTSSTSDSTFPVDPSAKARQRLEQFVAHAHDGVSGDIAHGHGEYLTSLEVLAGIPIDARATFQTEMQSLYAVLYAPHLSRKEAEKLVVHHAWSAGYGKADKKHNPTAASGL